MKCFNTTAVCVPEKHYMVDISDKVNEIKKLVYDGKYFTVNRARQYGKTTTLLALENAIKDRYCVISLDFQGIGADSFKDEPSFVSAFSRLLIRKKLFGAEIPDEIVEKLQDIVGRKQNKARLAEFYDVILLWVVRSERPVVVIIDEVDSAADDQSFLDFLSLLREGYIGRERNNTPAFQSVILAGVSDIKHLKSRVRDNLQQKVNSPWNIAADFDIDMSLSVEGIAVMLEDYESDHNTGMDTIGMAEGIRNYTGGYPFLVSRICQILDEKLVPGFFSSYSEAWTENGLVEAIKNLLSEKNPLFDSLTGKLITYPFMRNALTRLLMEGIPITYNPMQEAIAQMEMYGFVRNVDNKVVVSNRIFETLLYNLFLSDEELNENSFSKDGAADRSMFIREGGLDIRLILERFITTYTEIFGPLNEKFKEKDGRELFLLYLKPIINGTGNYYIEAQTRDQKRTDIIVDYLGSRYIIELKIWHGERYNSDGEKQICEYLDYFGLSTGYMLSFNFNKKKQQGVQRVEIGDKVLYEGIL